MSQYDDPYTPGPTPSAPPPGPDDAWEQGNPPPGGQWQNQGHYQDPYPAPMPGLAIASLVLGIVSLPLCMCYGCPSLICGILACIFGYMVLGQIKQGAAPPNAKGLSIAGMICGVVGILLSGLLWMILILGIVLGSQ